MVPLVVAIVWLGVYPKPVLDRMQSSAERVVRQVESRALGAPATFSEAR
jgi:NADH:ubiquinone oxidoreductase subunit 4 (subunit M)